MTKTDDALMNAANQYLPREGEAPADLILAALDAAPVHGTE